MTSFDLNFDLWSPDDPNPPWPFESINEFTVELYAWDHYQEALTHWGIGLFDLHDGCADRIRGIRADQIIFDDLDAEPMLRLDYGVHSGPLQLGEAAAEG